MKKQRHSKKALCDLKCMQTLKSKEQHLGKVEGISKVLWGKQPS